MKALLLNFFVLCFLQSAFCQITGKLINAGGRPVALANVLLLKSTDSSVVRSAVTDEKGAYRIDNINPGKYIVRFSSIGYKTYTLPVFELSYNSNRKDFGICVMKEEAGELAGVVVRAEKPLYQQQPEGLVVNVESSVLTKGSSALEVLERSPGVMIDHHNNSIALNGKSGVIVMIDGRLMHMSMDQLISLLNSMSADDISSIELLTTPSAKYDAEGSAGIINIVLKKSKKKGTNGSVALTGGYGWGEKASANASIDHNTGEVDVYGSYTFSHDRSYSYLTKVSVLIIN